MLLRALGCGVVAGPGVRYLLGGCSSFFLGAVGLGLRIVVRGWISQDREQHLGSASDIGVVGHRNVAAGGDGSGRDSALDLIGPTPRPQATRMSGPSPCSSSAKSKRSNALTGIAGFRPNRDSAPATSQPRELIRLAAGEPKAPCRDLVAAGLTGGICDRHGRSFADDLGGRGWCGLTHHVLLGASVTVALPPCATEDRKSLWGENRKHRQNLARSLSQFPTATGESRGRWDRPARRSLMVGHAHAPAA